MLSLNLKESWGVFNIGTGRSHSVGELIEITQHAAGTCLPVHSTDETRPDEIMDTVADITRGRTILGWEPQWSLTDGIATLIATEGRTKT